MSGYRILDHTADLAIEARGRDYPELVLQAALGLLALLLDRADIAPTDSVAIRAEGPTRERALVRALREMLDLIEDEGRVPVSAALGSGDPTAPELAIGTAPLETARPHLVADIKAVTYHDLHIREEERGLVVRIVFDI